MTAETSAFSVFVGDAAGVTSSGKLFQSLGPAAANDRSRAVTRRDGRTTRSVEDDDRRRRTVVVGVMSSGPILSAVRGNWCCRRAVAHHSSSAVHNS